MQRIMIELEDIIIQSIKEKDFDSARMTVQACQGTIAEAIKYGKVLPKEYKSERVSDLREILDGEVERRT